MLSSSKRKFIALFFALLMPLGFFFFFEYKKHKTGIRMSPLPVLGTEPLPDFQLIAHTGDTITRAILEGKIVIADFFFTNCRGICPVMSRQMARVQDFIADHPNLKSEFMLLSHTVDPHRDNVEVLHDYAQAYDVDSTLWLLLTGDRKQLYDLSIGFYKLPAFDNPEDTLHPYTHSERFTLLDKEGIVRGYYDGTDSSSVKQLMKDIVLLDLSYLIKKKKKN